MAGLVPLVIHELVHFQQARVQGINAYRAIYGPKKSLLALAIREGAADFLASLAAGGNTNEAALSYLVKHEKELWEQFQTEMNRADSGEWMWNPTTNPERPRDLGYAQGYRIVEAYYESAGRTPEAIRAILAVTDYPAFLAASGYADRSAERPARSHQRPLFYGSGRPAFQ